uniref:ATP-dependent DNA helicase n=1 Tax=Lactuca sativa TaxID=4236 RepID=A0A9R1WDL7_LACSA|nr:hypothetical protein LSAT_V11C100040220 [Lactuca sativa]
MLSPSSLIIKLRLTINMRALIDQWFSDFLLQKSLNALIDAIFPSLESNRYESDYIILHAILSTRKDYIIFHAILSTRNDSVDEINDYLICRFHGEERIYYCFDEAIDDINNFYLMELLNTASVSHLPPHYIRVKHNFIDVEIAVGQHARKKIFFPRILLSPNEDDMFPFKLKRKQFPIQLCFAMTINKPHGQRYSECRYVYSKPSIRA